MEHKALTADRLNPGTSRFTAVVIHSARPGLGRDAYWDYLYDAVPEMRS
jgi:hypothetical protein